MVVSSKDNWYKNNDTDQIWWKDTPDQIGVWIFSFDREEEFNMFSDYPHKKQIFDEENPYWKNFFANRQ